MLLRHSVNVWIVIALLATYKAIYYTPPWNDEHEVLKIMTRDQKKKVEEQRKRSYIIYRGN